MSYFQVSKKLDELLQRCYYTTNAERHQCAIEYISLILDNSLAGRRKFN
jgi:hypothetical protein